jgi:hypothetical protein
MIAGQLKVPENNQRIPGCKRSVIRAFQFNLAQSDVLNMIRIIKFPDFSIEINTVIPVINLTAR